MKQDISAYESGAIARKKGAVVDDNPYDETHNQHWEWIHGWIEGVPPEEAEGPETAGFLRLVRWDLCSDDMTPFMVEFSDGDYVKFEDVKQILSEARRAGGGGMKELSNDGEVEFIELLPCPFCGNKAEKQWVGNRCSKKRKLVIACTGFGCTTKQTTAVLSSDNDRLNKFASDKWNLRK